MPGTYMYPFSQNHSKAYDVIVVSCDPTAYLSLWVIEVSRHSDDSILYGLPKEALWDQINMIRRKRVNTWTKITGNYWRLLETTREYWKLPEVTINYSEDYWKLLEITRDYWRLLEITGDYWKWLNPPAVSFIFMSTNAPIWLGEYIFPSWAAFTHASPFEALTISNGTVALEMKNQKK